MSILININLFMSYVLNKFRLKISLIKKKKIYSNTDYIHRGIPLHLYKNNLTYHSTSKNITGKIFN